MAVEDKSSEIADRISLQSYLGWQVITEVVFDYDHLYQLFLCESGN